MTKKLTVLEKFTTILQYVNFENYETDEEVKAAVQEAFTQGVSDGYIKSFVLLNAEIVGTSVFIKVLIDETEKEYRIIVSRGLSSITDII